MARKTLGQTGKVKANTGGDERKRKSASRQGGQNGKVSWGGKRTEESQRQW